MRALWFAVPLLAACSSSDGIAGGIDVSDPTVSNLNDASVRIDHLITEPNTVVVVAVATIDPEFRSHVVGDQTDGPGRVLDLLVSHKVGEAQVKLFAESYAGTGVRQLNITSGGGLDQLIAIANVTGARSFGATAMAGEESAQAVIETGAVDGELVLGLYAGRDAEITGLSASGVQHHIGDVGVGRALLASAPIDEPLVVSFSEAQEWAAVGLVFSR